MVVALESKWDAVDLARALNVDVLGAVDHNFCDGIVIQEWLKRAETKYLCSDLFK
jgi:hypothetical protein